MTNYREILRLANLGLNRTSIGATLGYSRNTVADVLKRAGEKNVAWPLPDGMSDVMLEATLYPEKAAKEANRRIPDYEKIHKDLGKHGKSLPSGRLLTRGLVLPEYRFLEPLFSWIIRY